MAVVRFNACELKGFAVKSARLFLRPVKKPERLKYMRLSTVSQNWKEGKTKKSYGKPSGATYNFADQDTKKEWAWPGSQFCDASFGSGNSISFWGKVRQEGKGWVSVNVHPDLIYALAGGDTDGLALQEGGTPALFNNMIYASESGKKSPYLRVITGEKVNIFPEDPDFYITPIDNSIKIQIKPSKNAFFWKVFVNGKQLDRWKVKHPEYGADTDMMLEGLKPLSEYKISVEAVSRTGQQSRLITKKVKTSDRFKFDGIKSIRNQRSEKKFKKNQLSNANAYRVLPGVVKIDPLAELEKIQNGGSVWNGGKVSLFGIKGEYVDFQLCFPNSNKNITIGVEGFERTAILETYKMWYAKTQKGRWQSAYNIPVKRNQHIDLRKNDRIGDQKNQAVYLDIYIQKDAAPGLVEGNVCIKENQTGIVHKIPLILQIYDLIMPDKLAFWPEMNAYHIPKNVHDYYRLAHKNRCVANFWAFRPKVRTVGDRLIVDWKDYDKIAGPLLSGKAFENNPRKNVPVECMYLPFIDSWPTPLSKDNYDYQGYWPKKGDSKKYINRHYQHSKYIGDALSSTYKNNLLSVQKQFFTHFAKKGWDKTEMQFFFGGKSTHRIDYGVNMWWTTDEPYHWEDWLALQFFNRLWTQGEKNDPPKKGIWFSRADISRPQWQGNVLEGVVDTVYYGGFNTYRDVKRAQLIGRDTGISIRAYGNAGKPEQKNMQLFLRMINVWLNGADAFLPWQTIGNDKSLDMQESCEGNALFVSGKRFGLPVVGDLRLKTFRNAEQFIEYLVLLENKYAFTRSQIRQVLLEALSQKSDNQRLEHMEVSQLYSLRQKLLGVLANQNEN